VANKLDMVNERKVTNEAGKRCATRYGIEYFEVSARDGTNVNDVFNEISKQIKLVLELEENVIKKTYISLKGYIDQDKNCKC
jgi:nitrogenase molybdenum-iron protein alpha/beta subunit